MGKGRCVSICGADLLDDAAQHAARERAGRIQALPGEHDILRAEALAAVEAHAFAQVEAPHGR